MVAYSLSPGLSGVGVGTIKTEEHTMDNGLFEMPMPASAASAKILFDLFGASRQITITGVFTGTPAEVAAFVVALDAISDGSQVKQTYTSGKSGVSYEGLIMTSTWNGEEGAVTKVDYSISFTQGSA